MEAFIPNEATLRDDDSVVISVDKLTPYLDKTLSALGLHTEARTSFITFVALLASIFEVILTLSFADIGFRQC